MSVCFVCKTGALIAGAARFPAGAVCAQLAASWHCCSHPHTSATAGPCAAHRPCFGSGGELLWAGLRVRIGMSYGHVSSKKPLNTGRADYFGVLPNMSARVSALAAPGQVGGWMEMELVLGERGHDARLHACCLPGIEAAAPLLSM